MQDNSKAIRVLIADDHPLFRMGLTYALKQQGFDVIAEVSNGQDAISACQDGQPDVALLDVKMPQLDGVGACESITSLNPAPLVIMLTTFEEPAIIQAAKDAGATGYLNKETDPAELARIIRAIVAKPTQNWLPHVHVPRFTNRETQVLALLAQGLSNKAIAKTLELSPETIKDYLNNVYRKLEVEDRVSALKRSHELGLIQVQDT